MSTSLSRHGMCTCTMDIDFLCVHVHVPAVHSLVWKAIQIDSTQQFVGTPHLPPDDTGFALTAFQ